MRKLISRTGNFSARSTAFVSDFAVFMERALQSAAVGPLDKGRAIAVAMHMTVVRIA